MVVLGSLFVMAVGLGMLYFPEAVYRITESWKNSGSGEPSEWYKVHTRIGGAVFLLVGGGCLIVWIVS